MRRMLLGLSVAPALCGLLAVAPVQAQETLKEAVDPIRANAAADALEPDAKAALEAMGAYLAGLQTFDLATSFEADLVLDNGQKVGLGGTTSYEVKRPDGLKVELVGDLGTRNFFYDGKVLTVVSPKDKVFGQVDVAPTIKEMLEQVAYHLSIELPLTDLFSAGADEDISKLVTEGFFVSDALIGGEPTKHYAFRTEGKDFEIWIKDGDAPLPLKIVIDDDTEAARPRFESNLTWTTDAIVAASDFAFNAPDGYEQIDFVATTTNREVAK